MNEYIDQNLYDEILANSNVVTGDEYRKLVCTVAQIASDVVVKTLGPYGATTVIDDGSGITYPTKDGWACLSRLQFIDPIYNTIFQMLKKISFNSVTTVGDGTTTAMVVANNFLKELYTEFIPKVKQEGSFRQADFVETMIKTSKVLEDKLKSNSNVKIIDSEGDFHDIWKIAYVATNGNKNFADIILFWTSIVSKSISFKTYSSRGSDKIWLYKIFSTPVSIFNCPKPRLKEILLIFISTPLNIIFSMYILNKKIKSFVIYLF